ncbi:SGNH/GDSL hydrolase family protein [Simiduia sp. 21SJ11W-1]|uniref:SGNH/GDSL hydrolase family protein n=1 Tax=Simiduia sp. 21SJ11W-1 TaxID=2909669 RepID=UPI00209C8F43|nr:SGNH/GDSL hydrolase family protein [Simiduia sp. 21SJ11W-1]UTA46855.1 SGNH/GDSL hydrolase family protein [Simiduia sp. 21SJ11W-1]
MPYTSDSREFDELTAERPEAKRILAEGDSWFAYPRRYLAFGKPANIVHHLAKKDHLVIYATASNGDEALTMLSGEQKLALMKRISNTHFDYLLFSGGGNDIVGRYDLDYLVKPFTPGGDRLAAVHQDRLQNKLLQLRAVYEELIHRVMQFSHNPNTRIVTHCYDYPIPNKRGYALFDLFPIGESWMYPVFKYLGYQDVGFMAEVVQYLLEQFRAMLQALAVEYPGRFTVVDTQGTLSEKHWRNEIHPNSAGFKLVAKKLLAVL